MCALIGATGTYELDKALELFKHSRIRGLHSFGYSFAENGEVWTRKFLDYNEFVEDFSGTIPDNFIAHFRYSTSGDWHKPENNQPIATSELSLVFNGVIDMRPKQEMETAYKVTLTTENDGELALLKQQDSSLAELVNKKGVTFAGLFLDKEGKIVPVRNSLRPLYRHETKKATYYASTNDILVRSGLKSGEQVACLNS